MLWSILIPDLVFIPYSAAKLDESCSMYRASNKISTSNADCNNCASEKSAKEKNKAKILSSDHNKSAVRSHVQEIGHY